MLSGPVFFPDRYTTSSIGQSVLRQVGHQVDDEAARPRISLGSEMGIFGVKNVLKENACPPRRSATPGVKGAISRLRMPGNRRRAPAGRWSDRCKGHDDRSGKVARKGTRRHVKTRHRPPLPLSRHRCLASGEAGLKSRDEDVDDEERPFEARRPHQLRKRIAASLRTSRKGSV
jgi:hypothetical protein